MILQRTQQEFGYLSERLGNVRFGTSWQALVPLCVISTAEKAEAFTSIGFKNNRQFAMAKQIFNNVVKFEGD